MSVAIRAEEAVDARSQESVHRRYVATFVAQLVQVAAAIVTAGIVPRSLGAAAYGNYSFLLNMAGAIRGITEPSVQQAFFTFSAQEERTGGLTRLYAVWVFAQLTIILLFIGVASALGLTGRVWPGQKVDHILLVTFVEWGAFLLLSLKQLGDSKGLTVRPQLIGAASSAILLIGLAVLAGSGLLTFYSYALLNGAAAGITAIPLAYWLLVKHRDQCWSSAAITTSRQYVRRWWTYSSPLIFLEFYAPLAGLLSTYLVQAWYGSIEQGQLALASRWAAIVLLFTGAATNIFWREVASAIGRGDRGAAAEAYVAFGRVLIFTTMALSTWLAAGSSVLVAQFAGPEYVGAIPVLAIMAFYPVQQTFGQLNTIALKAAGRTAAYRSIAIWVSLPDVALTYLLLAPREATLPGLNLGATGVALRMVVYGLVSVQAYERSNARHFGIAYGALLRERAGVLVAIALAGLLLLVGYRSISEAFRVNAFVSFVACSAVYFGLVSVIALRTLGAETFRALIGRQKHR